MSSHKELFEQIAAYKYGQSRKSLIEVTKRIRDTYGDPAARKDLTEGLTVLLVSDATADCKRFVCEQLSIIGTAKQVPALAKVLTDERFSHMARLALERIPDASAAGALRSALSKAKGRILIGLINSVGERRDLQAVRALSVFVSDRDTVLAEAAVAALGKIGGREACKVLAGAPSRLSQAVADAYLKCAEGFIDKGQKRAAADIYRELSSRSLPIHVRQAALRGLKAAQER